MNCSVLAEKLESLIKLSLRKVHAQESIFDKDDDVSPEAEQYYIIVSE